MTKELASIGLAVHTGWAHAVAVADRENAPVVVHKERIALWDPPDPAAAQAYHRAADLPLEQAERAIAADEREGRRVTARSLRSIADALAARGHRVVAARVVDKARRPLPPLANVLASHPLLHAAEGALFRRIVLSEAGTLFRDAAEIEAEDLTDLVAKAASLAPRTLAELVARAGKASGSPWSKEHKDCALAAWLALLRRTES